MRSTGRERGGQWRGVVAIGIVGGAALAGCGERDVPVADRAAPAADSAVLPPPPPRPASLRDTLWLEGMPEPVSLALHRSPPNFPLPFSTYLPAELVPRPAGSGAEQGTAAARFVARLGGVLHDSAYLEVRVPRGEVSPEEAAERTRQLAERLGRPQRRSGESRYPWAREWYSYDSPGGRVGQVLLGVHGGQPFWVVVRHPAALAEGMEPRVDALLEHWRWADSGEGLAPE